MYQSLPFRSSALALAVALTAGCSDNGSSSNNIVADNLPVIEQAPVPTYRISANGGNGSIGGGGGYISIAKANSSAAIRVVNTDTVVLDPQLPAISADLGTNPAVISTDTLLSDIEVSGGTVATGELYLYRGGMYRYDGATAEVDGDVEPVYGSESSEVTGLEVGAGATLTLQAGEGYTSFENDVVVKGTLTSGGEGSLSLEAYAVLNEGYIKNPGNSLSINAALISNSGDIDTSAEAGSGQGGGYISLYALAIDNSGALLSEGASLSEENAEEGTFSGSGGYISLAGGVGVLNSGSIDTSAAPNTHPSNGYSSGSVSIYGGLVIANTGSIDTSGEATTADSYGTPAGSVQIQLAGGLTVIEEEFDSEDIPAGIDLSAITPMLVNTGDITANGGATTSDHLRAGSGGYIYLTAIETGSEYNSETETYETVNYYDTDVQVAISGNFSSNGGDNTAEMNIDTYTGASGGYGGGLGIMHYSSQTSTTETQLLGYESISAQGGDAPYRAGSGGAVLIDGTGGGYGGIRIAVEEEAEESVIAAPVNLVSDINVSSGTLIDGNVEDYAYAAYGGYIQIGHYYSEDAEPAAVSIEANLTADSTSVSSDTPMIYGSGGEGGEILMFASGDLTFTGAISALGADATFTGTESEAEYVAGGEGGDVSAYSSAGNVSLNSTVNLAGGSGLDRAGNAGEMYVSSDSGSITIAGSLTLDGGDADATLESSFGGNGGDLYMYSETGAYNLSASYTITGGSGVSGGLLGSIFEDETCIAGQCLLSVDD